MQSFACLYPVCAMALLSFGVSLWLYKARVKAIQSCSKLSYFKFNQGEMPDFAKQAEQHYANLFEMPVLFYIVLLVAFVTQTDHLGLVVLAWIYVLLRLVHTYIHLGSNYLLYRMRSFLASFAVLFAMWIWVLIALLLK